MSKSVKDFHTRLHRWYAAHGRRDLPWRNTEDAYAIYLSEIMLQQTQVKTVLERYYSPFLKRFPTLRALADAPQKDVLSAWQGLGYYNRAINLQRAAQACGGRLPDTVDALIALPGIGRNTAHAVAAFAYRRPVAVMEANVKRVLSRIHALEHPLDADLWDKAHALLDGARPFDYNQAMMDIGATVCTRRAPRCDECPAQGICHGQSFPEAYPAAKRKKAAPIRHRRIAIFMDSKDRCYATPRQSKFLNGLYHFAETERDDIPFQDKNYTLSHRNPIGHIRQQYSHFTLEADVYLIRVARAQGPHWHTPAQLQTLPVSMAEKKIIALLKL